MNLNLTMPAKAGLGASAAAGTSLAAAGAGGAFSSGTQLEKVEEDKENLVEESTSEDEVKNQEQPQTVTKDSQEPQIRTDKEVVDNVQESIPRDSFYSEDNFNALNKSTKVVRLISQDQTRKYESGTLGQRYSKFLVSVSSNEGDGNEDWWNEKYTDKYGTASDEEHFKPFETSKKITKGYDKNLSLDSLNGFCHSIYQVKKTKDEVKQKEEGKSHSIWAGLWIFCSSEKYDPYFIGDNNSSFSPKPTNNLISYKLKSQLLSTAEELTEEEEEDSGQQTEIENEFIWKKLNYHFFTTEDVKDEYFKSFKEKNLSTYPSNEKIPLKDKCDEAYKIQTKIPVGENRPSDEALLKYCSLGD